MNQSRAARLSMPLKWGLAGTVLATLASLIWPTHNLVAVQDREGKPADAAISPRKVASVHAVPSLGASGLAHLQPLIESSAASAAGAFDPFVGLVPPPPPAPPPVAPVLAVVAPPVPPPQEYRFLGRVTGPDGVDQVLLGHGDAAIPVKAGTALDNGYVVDSVSTDAIVLIYPSLGTRTTVPIPKS